MTEIFGLTLALWLSVYGFSMIIGQHQFFARWTGRTLRGAVSYLWRQLVRFVQWVWRRHWKLVVGFAAGVLVALYATGYFR